jgi:hypothetical protein
MLPILWWQYYRVIQPIPVIQLSAELEELRININLDGHSNSQDYWNTGLFLGAGYRSGNATIEPAIMC